MTLFSNNHITQYILFPNCQIKIKFAKRSSVLILYIFKIWNHIFEITFYYSSCRLSCIFWSSFYNESLTLLTKANKNLNLLAIFILYNVAVKHWFLGQFKSRGVNLYLFWNFVTFSKIYFLRCHNTNSPTLLCFRMANRNFTY